MWYRRKTCLYLVGAIHATEAEYNNCCGEHSCEEKVTYGIEVPTSINNALCIDKENENMFWTNAVNLEISNVGIAFEVLKKGQQAPSGWRKSSGHIIFDVKMDFPRKVR